MIRVSVLTCNPVQVNSYFVVGDDGSCAIIDPGCMSEREREQFVDFVEKERLEPKAVWLTHLHLDHVYGAGFVAAKWNIPIYAGVNEQYLYGKAGEMAKGWGLPAPEDFAVDHWLKDGDKVALGEEEFDVREVPGHTKGSLVYVSEANGVCFSGDVLFRMSVGRSDLPGGDGEALVRGIRQKLMTLPDEMAVCPGHGPTTSICDERKCNPYLMEL